MNGDKSSPENMRAGDTLFPASPFSQGLSTGSATGTGGRSDKSRSLFDLAPKLVFEDSVNLIGTGIGPDKKSQAGEEIGPKDVEPFRKNAEEEKLTGGAALNDAAGSAFGEKIIPADLIPPATDESLSPGSGGSFTRVGSNRTPPTSRATPADLPHNDMGKIPTSRETNSHGSRADSTESGELGSNGDRGTAVPKNTYRSKSAPSTSASSPYLEGASLLSDLTATSNQPTGPRATSAPSPLSSRRDADKSISGSRGERSLSELFFAKQQGNPAAALLPAGGFKKEFDSSLLSDVEGSYANSIVGGRAGNRALGSNDPYKDSDYYYSDTDSQNDNHRDTSGRTYGDSQYDYDDYSVDDKSEDQYGEPYYDYYDDNEESGNPTDYGDYGGSEDNIAPNERRGNDESSLPKGNVENNRDTYLSDSIKGNGDNNDRNNYKFSEYDTESNSGYSINRDNKDDYGSSTSNKISDNYGTYGTEGSTDRDEYWTPDESKSSRLTDYQTAPPSQRSPSTSDISGASSGIGGAQYGTEEYIENYNTGESSTLGLNSNDDGRSRGVGYRDGQYKDDEFNEEKYVNGGYGEDPHSNTAYGDNNNYRGSGYADSSYSTEDYGDSSNNHEGKDGSSYSNGDSLRGNDNYDDSLYSNDGYGDSSYNNDKYGDSLSGNDNYDDDSNDGYGDSSYNNDKYGDSPYNDKYGDSSYDNDEYGDSSYKNDKYGDSSYNNDKYGDSSYNNDKYGDSSYNDKYGDSSYNNDKYGDSPYNDKYGDSSYNNDKYGDGSYNNDKYGDSSYNNDKYGDSSYNNDEYGDSPYNNDKYGDGSHNNDKYSDSSYSSDGYDDSPYGNNGYSEYQDDGYGGSQGGSEGYNSDPYNDNLDGSDTRDYTSGGNDEDPRTLTNGQNADGYFDDYPSDYDNTDKISGGKDSNSFFSNDRPGINKYTPGRLEAGTYGAGVTDPGPPPKNSYANNPLGPNFYSPDSLREPEIATSLIDGASDNKQINEEERGDGFGEVHSRDDRNGFSNDALQNNLQKAPPLHAYPVNDNSGFSASLGENLEGARKADLPYSDNVAEPNLHDSAGKNLASSPFASRQDLPRIDSRDPQYTDNGVALGSGESNDFLGISYGDRPPNPSPTAATARSSSDELPFSDAIEHGGLAGSDSSSTGLPKAGFSGGDSASKDGALLDLDAGGAETGVSSLEDSPLLPFVVSPTSIVIVPEENPLFLLPIADSSPEPFVSGGPKPFQRPQ